ncbi:MAG: DUF2914 domain-containing protein [Acidobacteria bacterium]|nr:DUF2914 domain-containing protein [Acidobacteriota bacterium]
MRPVRQTMHTSLPSPRKAARPLAALVRRYEKYSGPVLFGAGFLWDSLTLTRIDNLLDNALLLTYLAVAGGLIILTLRSQEGAPLPGPVRRVRPYFPWVLQFLFGGLFSSYVIFYFKSASFTRTQLFFLILVALLVGNEFLHDRLEDRRLLAVLYSFCLLSFFAFFLPVVLAKVNGAIFALAGVVSLGASLLVFSLGLARAGVPRRQALRPVAPWIALTLLAVNLLYVANLVPPVPLALKSAGIYHHVARTEHGYEVQYVPGPSYRFWKKWDDPFLLSPGESVYCYTAVFAPPRFRVPVSHVWSRKSAGRGWVQTDRIRFQVRGGREQGFRGYTRKQGIGPGRWRVEVETESGQILGRIDFTVKESPASRPPLQSKLLP